MRVSLNANIEPNAYNDIHTTIKQIKNVTYIIRA